MKIESDKFLAFNMPDKMKADLIAIFSKKSDHPDAPENDVEIKTELMKKYLSPSETNYLFTKTAMDLIKDIKIKDTPEIRQMILDNADDEATFLIGPQEHIKFIKREVDPKFGGRSVIAMYIHMDSTGYLTYDAFNVQHYGINHPRYLEGHQVDKIDTFLKMMIFTKCTNSEIEVLGKRGGKLPRRAKIDGEKYLNNLDANVTLVNAKHNKIVYRDEEFYVNPHGRFQPHGPKNSRIKYIIIDGYYKKGYKRNFKK